LGKGLVPHRVAQNLPNLLHGAAPMALRPLLEPGLHVLFEVSYQKLSHIETIS
jgi:hypothetical protein